MAIQNQADIRNLKTNEDSIVFPVTHEKAVIDSSGITLETKLKKTVYFKNAEQSIADIDAAYLKKLAYLAASSVTIDPNQELDETQQQYARYNIGAASEDALDMLVKSTANRYTCTTIGSEVYKQVNKFDGKDVLVGGKFQVLFSYKNTVDSPYLVAGAVTHPLYWNGTPATADNTWDNGMYTEVSVITNTFGEMIFNAKPIIQGVLDEVKDGSPYDVVTSRAVNPVSNTRIVESEPIDITTPDEDGWGNLAGKLRSINSLYGAYGIKTFSDPLGRDDGCDILIFGNTGLFTWIENGNICLQVAVKRDNQWYSCSEPFKKPLISIP